VYPKEDNHVKQRGERVRKGNAGEELDASSVSDTAPEELAKISAIYVRKCGLRLPGLPCVAISH
jgi:hypothetical protein